MQISGEYGTELLLRYTEEQRSQELERRRIVNERQAEATAGRGPAKQGMRMRLAALLGTRSDRMPVDRTARTAGVSQVHAAHR